MSSTKDWNNSEFPQEVSRYYASIEDSFRASEEASKNYSDWKFVFALASAMLSVLPFLPALVWLLVLWFGRKWHPTIRGWSVPVTHFLFWWIFLAGITVAIALFLGYQDSKRTKRIAKLHLSPAVMRFTLCFALTQELDRYTRNRLARHSEKALEYWSDLLPRIRAMLNPSGAIHSRSLLEITSIQAADLDPEVQEEMMAAGLSIGAGYSRYRSIFPQIDFLRLSQPWFKLADDTAEIVNAFNSLTPKLDGRLKDHKDLPQAIDVLRHLAVFLFCSIPELSTGDQEGATDLAETAQQSLREFAQAIRNLQPYRPEPKNLVGKEKATANIETILGRTLGLFSHENLLLRFCAWWLTMQLFVLSCGVGMIRYFQNVKVDSTLLALFIGTPLLVAAAALAASQKKN